MNSVEIKNRLNPIRRKWAKILQKTGLYFIIAAIVLTFLPRIAPYLKIFIFEEYLFYTDQLVSFCYWIGVPTLIIGFVLVPRRESQEEKEETDGILRNNKDLHIARLELMPGTKRPVMTDQDGRPIIAHKRAGEEDEPFFISNNARLLFFTGIMILISVIIYAKFINISSTITLTEMIFAGLGIAFLISTFYPRFVYLIASVFNIYNVFNSGLLNGVFDWVNVPLLTWLTLFISFAIAYYMRIWLKSKYTPNEFQKNWREEYRNENNTAE